MLVVMILYFIANVALSTALDRHPKRSAVIGHAFLFGFTFVLVLFCTDIPAFRNVMVGLLGSQYDHVMGTILIGDVPVLLPFAVVEFLVLVQMFVATVVFASRVVVKLIGAARKKYEFLHDIDQQKPCVPVVVERKKLYYILSTLLC